ncbi:hypothetical protein Tco_0178477 [Tanacetum coccineum]
MSYDHRIPLIEGTQPVNIRPYRHPPTKKDDFKTIVKELLEAGAIKVSNNPFASRIVLVKKKDNTWRMCLDYRQLNKNIVKNKFPIPIIEELIDELHGATIFCKLDLSYFDDYYSEDQYAVSIKENTAYPCLRSPKTIEDKAQYAVSRESLYAVFNIWNEYNILEDIKRGPYSKKSPIRRDLDNSTINVLIPLDSWTSGLLVYKLPLRVEYGVSTSIGYGVSSFLSNTAYSSQQINTAYPLPLDTANRSSGTETEIIDFRAKKILPSFGTNPTDCLSLVSEYSEEEEAEAMAEIMEQYTSKTRTDYGSGVARPKIEEKDSFELKGQFLKELRENTFSGSDNEDANEHIEKVLEIVDLFHVPNITVDQLMLRVFPISLTGATSRWLRNEPTGSIKTLNKYCPPGRTAKKMEEINNF